MRRAVLVWGCLLLAGCGESKPTGISAAKRTECEQLVARTYQEINRLNADLDVQEIEFARATGPGPVQLTLTIHGGPGKPLKSRPNPFAGKLSVDAGAFEDDQMLLGDRDRRQVAFTERRIKIVEMEQALHELEQALIKNSPEAIEAAQQRLTSK